MKPRIITISREYGSGGQEIGRQVAERLGIGFLDKELINEAARASGLGVQLVQEMEESTGAMPFFEALSLNRTEPFEEGHPAAATIQDRMFLAQSNIIRQAAEKDPCVIVGRAANHVLAGRKDCLHVYIYADLGTRIDRVAERLDITTEEAAKKIAKVDRARAAYYRYYTGEEWGLARNYNLSLDSGFLSSEGCIKAILTRVPPEWKPHEVRAV